MNPLFPVNGNKQRNLLSKRPEFEFELVAENREWWPNNGILPVVPLSPYVAINNPGFVVIEYVFCKISN